MTKVLHEKEKYPFGFRSVILREFATSGNAREIGVTPALFTHLDWLWKHLPIDAKFDSNRPNSSKSSQFCKEYDCLGANYVQSAGKGIFLMAILVGLPTSPLLVKRMPFLFERTSVAGR